MKPVRLISSILFACLFALPQAFPQSTSTQGREFWLSFMHNGFKEHADGGWVVNQVLVSAKRDCTGTVSNPLTGWSQGFSVSAGGVATVGIPEEQGYHDRTEHERIYEKGIKVTASDTVSVYCTNIAHVSFDASFVLPVESLGDEYVIQCCEQSRPGHTPYVWNNETTAFVIVATEDNTTIDITPSVRTLGGHSANQTFSITMHAGETYHVRSERITSNPIDLSGTRVRARGCKRIAVFNGNTVTCVPADAGNGYDHVFEQAMPLRSWGKNFVVTTSKTRLGDYVKVTSGADGNIVTRNGAPLDTLAAGRSLFFPIPESEGSCYLQTSQPSAVYLYNTSHDTTDGDPSMVWIAPVEQRIRDVTFSTFDHPDIQIQTHCVNIVVKTDDIGDVYLDGERLPSSGFARVNGNGAYSYARLGIPHGVHRIRCDKGFNAHVYGFGHAKGYAYLAGSNAVKLSATLSVNGETVSPYEDYPFCPDRELTFSADVSHEQYTLLWDFGDGATSTENPAVHTYAEPLLYNASLLVATDEGGCWDSASDTTFFFIDASQQNSHEFDTAVCNAFLWDGAEYAETGDYGRVYTAANGCDSIVTCHLTVKGTLTGDTLTHEGCDSFVWHGVEYTEPGGYDETLTTPLGCDSVVHLDLSLAYSPRFDMIRCTTPEAVVFGPSLDTVAVVTNTEHFSFQYTFRVAETGHPDCLWEHCLWTISKPSWAVGFDTIPKYDSLTGRHYSECTVFVSERDADYVVLTATMGNGCGSGSHSIYLKSSFLDVGEHHVGRATIRPNPTTGRVSITGGNLQRADVVNLLGQRVLSVQGDGDELQLDLSRLPAGVYMLRVTMGDGSVYSDKVVKE